MLVRKITSKLSNDNSSEGSVIARSISRLSSRKNGSVEEYSPTMKLRDTLIHLKKTSKEKSLLKDLMS